jgi:hypothetical protein
VSLAARLAFRAVVTGHRLMCCGSASRHQWPPGDPPRRSRSSKGTRSRGAEPWSGGVLLVAGVSQL